METSNIDSKMTILNEGTGNLNEENNDVNEGREKTVNMEGETTNFGEGTSGDEISIPTTASILEETWNVNAMD